MCNSLWSADAIRMRNMSAPIRDVMRFHLIYSGPLPGTGNASKKPDEVHRIRMSFNPQLEVLWKTHRALKALVEEGWVSRSGNNAGFASINGRKMTPAEMAASGVGDYYNLAEPIRVGNCAYRPLVRNSLHLNCELDILFLRQEDPGALVLQGGDIDNRIKTLLDALRMPSPDENARVNAVPGLYHCLMESDTLVSSLNINTDRLLAPATSKPNEVHLVIGVTLNILRVASYNTCLL